MPLRELETWMWEEACEILDRADRLHRQFFRPVIMNVNRPTWEPPVDVYETDSAYTVVASLPGVKADALTISMHDGVLTIAGELVKAALAEDARALVVERGAGKFSRSLRQPVCVSRMML